MLCYVIIMLLETKINPLVHRVMVHRVVQRFRSVVRRIQYGTDTPILV
jgi:hypothetical protein